MQESQTWRTVLADLLKRPGERQRIAQALGINPLTLTRWVQVMMGVGLPPWGGDVDQQLVRDEIRQKSYLLSEFFGGSGAIDDPHPDYEDSESRRKYEKCFDELYRLISRGLSALTDFLERDDPHTLRTVSFGVRRLFGTTEAE